MFEPVFLSFKSAISINNELVAPARYGRLCLSSFVIDGKCHFLNVTGSFSSACERLSEPRGRDEGLFYRIFLCR